LSGLISLWLSKPLYELLPWFYLAAGVMLLVNSIFMNYWYWPTISLILGFACLIAGLVILLKRRDFRHNVSVDDLDDDAEAAKPTEYKDGPR